MVNRKKLKLNKGKSSKIILDDPSIYDDPNVLVGGEPISKNNRRQIKNNSDEPDLNYAPIALRNVFQNLPENNQLGESWERQFNKWARSNISRWRYDIKFITNLKTKDILNLYENLPKIILGRPKINSKKYLVFQHYQSYFDATSAWMKFFASSDVLLPSFLTEEPYHKFRKDALMLNHELNLCKVFLAHDSTRLKRIVTTSISLWLFIQYAKAVNEFTEAGLFKPLPIVELKTKSDNYKETGDYISSLKNSENLNRYSTIIIRNLKDLFNNLPSFVIWECRQIAEQDEEKGDGEEKDTPPFNAFNEFLSSMEAVQNLNRNGGEDRHAMTLYDSGNSTAIFTTKTKRPTLKSSKRKHRNT